MLHRLWLLLLLGISDSVGALWPGKHCFDGCDLTLSYVDFNDTDPELSKKIRTCQSVLHATSLYLCIDVYCEDDGKDAWLSGTNETCQRSVTEMLPPWSIIDDFTPSDIASLRKLRAEEGMWDSNNPSLGEVVIPDELFTERAFKTLDYAYFEIDIHWAYGVAMYYFWAVVIAIGVCWRLAFLIRGLRHQEWQPISNIGHGIEEHDRPEYQQALRRLPCALLNRYILIPATFGYRCSQNIGWCTIPPRIQTLTIFAFILINILFCCISYRVFDGNLYWSAVSTQLWRYISDRTGVISLANFPIVWLFGTRNNVLMWLTGWGFGTYNNFHRWVARVATVQAVVHSIGYTEMVLERGNWPLFMKYLSEHYFWNGEVATILMCAISLLSVYHLRRSHYEIFLAIHIILSVFILLTTFYHVEIFNGEYNLYIWPCFLIWIFDRLLRTLRILAFDRKFWDTKATATYYTESNLVRLEIPCSHSLMEPQPGTYYYIYVLSDFLFAHQNHPFTLAYVSSNNAPGWSIESPTPSYTNGPIISRLQPHQTTPSISTTSSESDSLFPVPKPTATAQSHSLVFLIRPYSGMTSRLRNIFMTSHPRSLRVLVEGPYGAPTTKTLQTFQHIVFIAGGTGIAVAIAYLSALFDDTSSHAINIHIVWAVREHMFFEEVLRKDIPADVLRNERLRLTVHITRGDESKDNAVLGDDMIAKGVDLKAGRPDVSAAVEKAAQEAGNQRLAVVACGPAQMADDARRACVWALGRGWRGVEYLEESFKW